jgi:hypothetical protein
MTKVNEFESSRPESLSADTAFPKEPFPCPACGQMLAPSCRVCVACKQPIDPTKIARLKSVGGAPDAAGVQPSSHPPEPVRFPWRVFFVFLAFWVPGALLIQRVLNPVKSQLILAGVQLLTSVWVFFDAQAKRVPNPLKWGLGSLLLWPLIFPWYLGRRSKPAAPCPFVEAPASPAARTVLFLLLIVFIFLILNGPPKL